MQTVINTLESGRLDEIVDRTMVLEFFQALNRVFQLEYGKVLLAISSRHELEEMMERGLPYWANFTEEVASCLNGTNCEGMRKLVETLGRVFIEIRF